jgi:hypothetical protein
MVRTLLRAAAGALLLAALPATASAATPTLLAPVAKTLSASRAVPRACDAAPATGRGLASATYTAPMSGYVTTRLKAASGDWDLLVRDRSGRRVTASQGFRSDEVAGAWVAAGDRLVAEGCRRSGRSSTARVSFVLADVAKPKAGAAPQLVRVYSDPRKLEGLDQLPGFDVTESRRAGYADVLVDGAPQLATLRRMGLRFDVRVANMKTAYDAARRADARYTRSVGAAGSPLPSGRTDYRDYTAIQDELKKLVADHPDTVRPVIIGTSFQGREIQGVEIARNVKGTDGRPTFFLMGVHHAREWPAAESVMEFAHLLADSPGDARVQSVLSRERVLLVPLVNPDGYISSRGAFDPVDTLGDPTGLGTTVEAAAPPGGSFAYRRKNCDGAIPSGSIPCELQYGVDNNRNYGNLWGGNGASQDPGSQSYHGPGPRSEPETQAVWNYARTHQVTNLISMHTVAALVLRPPGLHEAGLSPDEAAMKSLGDKMANATGYTSEYGFQLYDTAGTTEDDTYAATGGYGYTIEMGPEGGDFHMPYETAVVKEWTGDNDKAKGRGGLREALLLGAEAAADPADHAQLTGTATPGRFLRLTKSFDTKTSDYCAQGIQPDIGGDSVPAFLQCPQGTQPALTLKDKLDSTTTVPADGHFDWHINQSTRPFVGGGSLIEKLSDKPAGPGKSVDNTPKLRFDVTPQDAQNAVRINLDAALPAEDYDLAVYKVKPDGSVGDQVGSSAGPTGHEQVDLKRPEPGTYEAQVEDFTAVSDQYTLKEAPYAITSEITTGHKEAYTLTCEDGKGNVLSTDSLIIDRGQSVDLNVGCGTAPTTSAGGAGTTETPSLNGAPVANVRSSLPAAKKSVAKKKAKKKTKKLSARQQRARCRTKARRIHAKAKRRSALRRCEATYRKATKRRASRAR